MAFEKFTQKGRRFRPRLSIRKGGTIGLNGGAVRRFGLEEYEAVFLYYERENRRLGIEPTHERHGLGARTLTVRNKNVSISARPFLEYYGIDYSKRKSFSLAEDKESGLLVADLKEASASPGPAAGRVGRRRSL